jgi:hypothetical protein
LFEISERNVESKERAMKIGPVVIFALVCTTVSPVALKAQDWRNMPPPPRYQQEQQQTQDACMGDAMTLCGQYVPDRDRVAACLLSNRHRVSQPCRVMLSHWHG